MNEFINQFYLKLSRRGKRWVFRCLDLLIFGISIYLAFSIRFDLFNAFDELYKFQKLFLLAFPIKFLCFWFVGVYRPVLRYVGTEFLGTAIIAVIGSTGILLLTGFILVLPLFPRSVFILDSLLTLFLVISIRVVIRWLVYTVIANSENGNTVERVLIYGAGDAGVQLVKGLGHSVLYRVVGIIDDDKQLQNQKIGGCMVYSPRKLPKLIRKNKVDSILLAMPSIGKQKNREIVKKIQHFGVDIKTVPDINEIISGKVSINEIRNIDITDLLGREEVKPDPQLMKKNIAGKVVMVTGAGGSIGSELCRQIVQLNPKRLILFEQNEFSLYSIDLDLKELITETDIVPCLGSVVNKDRIEEIIKIYSVQTIYHAAAYKHVPLLESNPIEGILNNVKGTYICVDVALKYQVETFVLISTDKAVRPTNIMGATKRISELIIQAFAERKEENTRLVLVRFGNVLNSTGSVVPLFRDQLKKGQNLTLTDEKMTRYFMLIPEAARLVIQAGALGEGGDVFLLDMGKPVKIIDLATQMIELSGLKLGTDINIDITGIRPGEKLYEELLINIDNSHSTVHPKIFSAKECFIEEKALKTHLDSLFGAAETRDLREIMRVIKELVPEFIPDKHLFSIKEDG